MADTNLIYPYELEGGKKAVADEVMANFEAIQLVVAGLNSEINNLTTVLTELEKKPTREMMDIYYSFSSQAPVGAFPLWTGETINNAKTLYPQFWKKINQLAKDGAIPTVANDAEYEEKVEKYGQCASFYINTLDGHVRLPKITKFISSIDQLTDFGEIEAGLPEITGNIFNVDHVGSLSADGCFSFKDKGGNGSGGSGSRHKNADVTFNASSSNSIYGKSDTVQPPAVRLYLYLQVVNNTTELSEFNINVIAEQLMSALEELEAKKVSCLEEMESIYNQYIQGLTNQYDEINGSHYTKTEVDAAIENADVDLTGYATEDYVNTAIGNIDIPKTDLSDYYTKTETNTAIESAKEELSESIVSESEEWHVVDNDGNIVATIDANGISTTTVMAQNVTIGGIDIEELMQARVEAYVDEAILGGAW